MKKSIAILIALMLLIGAVFFGCGKKEEEPGATEQTTADTREQEDINALEDNLSKEALVMISNEFLKKGAEGNTLDTAAVRASVMNASGKTVTYAVVAFGLWDSEDKPIAVAEKSDGAFEYITRYSYMALKVPSGNIFGSEVLIPVDDGISDKVAYIKVVPVSCTFDDGTNWVNPHYEEFMKLYDGKTYVESDKGSASVTTDKNEQETTTGAGTADDKNDQSETTGNSNGQTNNGQTNNGQTNNGQTNNGQTNNGQTNNGQTDNGQTNNGQSSNDKYYVNKCIELFASGNYKMTVISEPGTEEEGKFTMSVKNGNMRMETTMEDIEAIMLYKASEDKTYMIFPSINMYTEVTEEMMGGDMDMSELSKEFNMSYPEKVTVSEKTFNGQTARCESVTDESSQSNFYFDASGNLIGREDFNSDGTVSVMHISGFTGNVDDSEFQIPKGCLFVNLSWIMRLMG